MKSISVSDNLHKWIMDHKDAGHKSADSVICGLISENDELKNTTEFLNKQIVELKK